ncbi:hypothetical protein KL942_001477 [Ogataea angusta]|uniref:Uncharacterized protein n=1 Tax=Pichia angusta TaxID=870730 RepID=A0AAN6I587_PICAN|nr:uncharacterized protein KL928_002732 [Ogataea angusta]KAG7818864.1 hypothetical protein KL928_002732 [Ogataea angusta]KAG7841598.1 hypothetical protein KL942_001477 [Ogataea angusta]KAG7848082.1 hypothetical protein KL941_002261 [Ogataea angusta]KAG7850825.1 hypothetical protein KL940_001402 [Ogataea angusta]KAG7859861.1 hypothetical protein KL919_002566 [Ogataea angusta]
MGNIPSSLLDDLSEGTNCKYSPPRTSSTQTEAATSTSRSLWPGCRFSRAALSTTSSGSSLGCTTSTTTATFRTVSYSWCCG